MKKRTILVIHILYWFYFINQSLFPLYVGNLQKMAVTGNEYLNEIAISLILNVLSFYVIYFAFPRISEVRKRILVIPASLLLVFLIMAVRLPAGWYFWKYVGHPPGTGMEFEWIWVWNELRLVVITGIYAVLIRFMIHAFETQKLRNELVTQKQAGELALLKSQVNPHFMFNTLNNIYSLVYQKSEEAPDAVMKFSSVMRYVLYDAHGAFVPLDKEAEYLESFIDLQKLRIKQTGFVQMETTGDTGQTAIAPMLLIPLVENAFKHGSKNHHPGIFIRLDVTGNRIRFEVANYIRKNQQQTVNQQSGLGLANLRRRLELTYPGRHSLTVKEAASTFTVTLEIQS